MLYLYFPLRKERREKEKKKKDESKSWSPEISPIKTREEANSPIV